MSPDFTKLYCVPRFYRFYLGLTGIKGTWYRTGTNGRQFKAKYGGTLTWWSTTKTIKLAGKWPSRDERLIRHFIDFDKKYAFRKPYEATKKTTHIEHDIDNMFNSL